MKFKLQTENQEALTTAAAHLFLINSEAEVTFPELWRQLAEHSSLLQKTFNKPNTFISSYHEDLPVGFFGESIPAAGNRRAAKDFKKVFSWLQSLENNHVYVHFLGYEDDRLTALMQFFMREFADVSYRFNKLKSNKDEKKPNKSNIIFLTADDKIHKKAFTDELILISAVNDAKDLANLPANLCTPHYLVDWVKNKVKKFDREEIKVKISERREIEELGMGAFLSVAKGSAEPPYFIQLEYYGKGKKDAPVVLVGKGITFDSGGISLKPAATMDEMKYDMGGAAAVLNTFFAAAALQLPLNLITLVPTCENMPSGTANKPGDIVKSLKGLFIEILNTDAEGRLILCDALTYAERFKPQAVIDVATLTGACVVALGHLTSGLLGNNRELIDLLLAAGQKSADKAWELPLDPEYGDGLKSNFADIANVGSRGAGAITAAVFLSRFIDKDIPWAHLDIAGTAWKTGAAKGATGRPVPLLVEFLRNLG